MTPNSSIPAPPLWLGMGGVIPFVAGSICIWAFGPENAPYLVEALIFYGASIVSFLGAIHWGRALESSVTSSEWSKMVWGVIPSLVAWIACLMTPLISLLLIMAALIGTYLFDYRSAKQGFLPNWYLRLRGLLTLGAVASLAISVLQLI